MHRDGFGFVIPDAKTLNPSLKSKLYRRHLHPAAPDRQCHARRPGPGRHQSTSGPTGAPKDASCGRSCAPIPPSSAFFTTATAATTSNPSTPKLRRRSSSRRDGSPELLCSPVPELGWKVDSARAAERRRGRKSVDRVLGDEVARLTIRTISKASWSTSKSPTGPRPRRIPRGRVIEILGREGRLRRRCRNHDS